MNARQTWVAFKTILIKEFLRFIRIWMQTVLPPMITTALYFVIFGSLIGSRLDPIDDHSYIDFIVPGLILMAIIGNAYANVVSSFYGSKFQHNIEEMLVSPVPNYVIVLGFVAGGVARGLIVGLAVTLVAQCFADVRIFSLPVTLLIAVATAVLFSLGGLINGVFANSFDDISIIPTFVLTPLTYLGGVFYSVDMLPEIWQHVSALNPILYMVNGFRYGMLGTSDVGLLPSALIIGGFIALMYVFALYLLRKGVGLRT